MKGLYVTMTGKLMRISSATLASFNPTNKSFIDITFDEDGRMYIKPADSGYRLAVTGPQRVISLCTVDLDVPRDKRYFHAVRYDLIQNICP